MTVTLDINTTRIQNGKTASANDLITPLNQLKIHQENMLNGLQAFEALLVGSGARDPSAAFQINSTTQGFAPPSMTTAERDAIASPLERSMIYNSTTKAYNLYNGSSWVVLAATGGSSPVEASCRVTKSAAQTIATSTLTILSWDTESYDTDTMHDTVTNNSRITFTTAGKYLLNTTVKFATSISNMALVQFILNGTTVIAGQTNAAPASEVPYVSVSCLYNFSASDYVQVRVFHTSGVNEDVDNAVSYFAASKQL